MITKPQEWLLDSIRDHVRDEMCLATETLTENSFIVYPWQGNVPYTVKVVRAEIVEREESNGN